AEVLLVSRSTNRAEQAVDALAASLDDAARSRLRPVGLDAQGVFERALAQADVLFASGAAGVELLSDSQLAVASRVKVAVDLNAVPPAGIAGIAPTDAGQRREDRVDYGALGVGELKMKIHRRAIAALFESNDRVLDTEAIYDLGRQLINART
ncbi:MAG: bifunctional NADP-dependent methylenetetrahydromethanopterin dehydrogenase/methylenetetrahydrofolate dehydrogenase, partial [Planctomycetota bacterium]